MEIVLIYVTCSDHAEAERIAAALVEKRLVSCANIFAPHTAVYRWQGAVETEPETAVIFKTQKRHFDAVKDAICELHSYDCPCVIGLPIECGHTPFLQWIVDETAV